LDTINELNPHHCGNYFKRKGKLENITVNLVQDYFRDHLKLLRIENVKNWTITTACPSGQATMTAKVLSSEDIGKTRNFKNRTLVCQGIETESWRDFTDK
jgi:hypothetical protein